jgi:hypothetical protein
LFAKILTCRYAKASELSRVYANFSLASPKILYAAVPLFRHVGWFKFLFMDAVVFMGVILCSPLLWFGIDKLSQRYPLVEHIILPASSRAKAERNRHDCALLTEEDILPFNIFVWNLVLYILRYAFRYNPN